MSPVSHKVETVSIIVLKFNWSKFTHNNRTLSINAKSKSMK